MIKGRSRPRANPPGIHTQTTTTTTNRELLLQHKKTIPNFLDHEYEKFFDSYRRMLRSDNYVTKRQSLRLLEDILVDRHNFQIMCVGCLLLVACHRPLGVAARAWL